MYSNFAPYPLFKETHPSFLTSDHLSVEALQKAFQKVARLVESLDRRLMLDDQSRCHGPVVEAKGTALYFI